MRQVRLLPLVIGAIAAMLTLKALVLVVEGGRLAGVGSAFAEEERAAPDTALFGSSQSRSRDDILESLSERREALEARERELDLREKLIEATRSQVESRISELRALEASIESRMRARKDEDNERFAGLVTMYESMKPRDAAKIFDRLEMPLLARVAGQLNARVMAEILAAMDPDVARRLTAELSAEPADTLDFEEGGDLPRIVGTQRES